MFRLSLIFLTAFAAATQGSSVSDVLNDGKENTPFEAIVGLGEIQVQEIGEFAVWWAQGFTRPISVTRVVLSTDTNEAGDSVLISSVGDTEEFEVTTEDGFDGDLNRRPDGRLFFCRDTTNGSILGALSIMVSSSSRSGANLSHAPPAGAPSQRWVRAGASGPLAGWLRDEVSAWKAIAFKRLTRASGRNDVLQAGAGMPKRMPTDVSGAPCAETWMQGVKAHPATDISGIERSQMSGGCPTQITRFPYAYLHTISDFSSVHV